MKREFTKLMAALALLLFIAPLGMWGQSTVLFHETFGNNSGSARAWDDSYSVKSGVSTVYSGITGYTVNNLKQSKNTVGHVQSGLIQTTKNQDAYVIIGPLNLAGYSDLNVTYWWKAASINGTYSTHLYYATSSTGTFTEVNGTGSGATTYVQRSYTLPNACQISSLYLKVVFNTSNTQALIDEVEITGVSGEIPTHAYTLNVTGDDADAEASLYVNGEELGANDEIAEGETVTVSVNPSDGYAYSVSVKDANNVAVEYDDEMDSFTMPTSAVFITVTTTLIPTYTVTFNTNGGTFVGNEDFPLQSNTKEAGNYTLPSATKEGFTFGGWLATGSANAVTGSYEVTGNVDFTAQWIQGVVDVLDLVFTGITGTAYAEWSDKEGTSGAVYAGQSAGNHDAIQLRATSPSGIVTTTSGGTVKKVTVVWEDNTQSGRTLNVYGSNTAYTNATNLYDEDTDGDLLGTIVYGTSTELVISGDYAFIGLRSASGAMYLSEIRIIWESSDTPSIMVTPLSLNTFANLNTSLDASAAQSVSVSGSNLTDDITVTVGNNSNFEISLAENSGYTSTITLFETEGTVSATPVYVRMKSGLSVGTYSGNLAITSTDASQVDIELNGNVAAVKTVPEAIAAIDAATGNTVTGAYVSGVVSYVDYFSTTNHYITYYISADGNRENELEVFHGKNLNGTDFTAQSDLLVGDQVVVYGNLTLYNNTVYEFESDNYLISFNRPAAQEYTLTVSNLSHVNMFVFDAENQSDPLFEGEGTAQVYNGTNILLSVEVEEGYGIQSLIVEGVDVASQLDESGAYTFYMPTRNVTITATAAVLPIVILCDDNTTLYGTTVTLPTRGNSGDYTFAGWCVTNYEEETTTTPTIIPAGAYQTTQQSIVLYPVYTRTEGGSGTEWHLINISEINEGGVYAILTNETHYAFNGTINSSGHGESTTNAFDFDANGVASSAPAGTLELTFTAVTGGFTIYNETTSRYLYASKAASGGLAWSALEDNYWYYGGSSDDGWVYSKNYDGKHAHLRVYNNTFRTYNSNSQGTIQLAQKVGGASGTTYYTSLLTSLNKTIAAPQGDRDSWYLIASPMVGTTNVMNVQNLINTNLNDFDLYRFDQAGDEDGNEWTNWKNNGALNGFNLEKGKGYLYANNTENDVVLTFTGTPYTGDGIVTLEKKDCSNASGNFEGWNLVGNPFAQTAYIDRDCYVMNSNRNQIVLGSSREVAAMEGVFVIAASDGETMTFSTTPLGKADSKVVMNVIDNQGVADRAIVRFGEGSQLPKFQLKGNSTKVYFQQGQEEFAIVAADNEGELPVNFKASRNGRYTMSINVEDLDMNYLHLIDNKTGNDVDLLATPSYTFQANSSDYENRFRLVFNANAIEENDTEANTTFAYYNGSEWVINNPSTGSGDNATLQVIDMMGRVLSSETLNGNANVNINQPAGIYMLRLVNGENVKVQKVVVR